MVVLIIGILAAVALPQYQKAVEKARAAEALSNIASFKKAVEVWKLANPGTQRTFTGNGYGVGQLDIDVPDDWDSDGSISSCSKNFCYDVDTNNVEAARTNSSTYQYEIEYWFDGNAFGFDGNKYVCVAKTPAALKLCNSLSNIDEVNDDTL